MSPEGEACWSPEEAIVYVGGRAGSASVSDLCCPVVNFFASAETGRTYLDNNPDLVGSLVTIREAVAGGRAIFGGALGSDHTRSEEKVR